VRVLSSIRVRLTLWYMLVLALALGGFAALVSYSMETSLEAAINRDMDQRAQLIASRWSRIPPPPAGPGPRRFGRVDLPPQPQAAPLGESDADRREFIRRPRFLNLEGEPLIPFIDDAPWDPETFWLAAAGISKFSTISIDGESARVLSFPLWRDGQPQAVVQIAHLLTDQQRILDGLTRVMLTLLPLALGIAALGGVFLTDRALRPVRHITQAAAELGAGDLSRRLKVRGKDELSQLALTFNEMIARLQEAFQRLEHLYEQQRRFTADASHELRTPLTTIKANTSLALTGQRSVAEYREALEATDEAADVMNRIVQDLLLLARSDSGSLVMDRRLVSLASVVDRAATGLRPAPECRMTIDLEPDLKANGDSHHLRRLFCNLLENAIRHTPVGEIRVTGRREGKMVRISVQDTGEGISPEHLPHVCDRFYRVDTARSRARGGAGLGLAICRSIAEAHGGLLEISSRVEEGTTATVLLPAPPESSTSPGGASMEQGDRALTVEAGAR
jgi:heavy metal sensor kinase